MRCWHSFSGVERPPLAPNIVRHEPTLDVGQRLRIAEAACAREDAAPAATHPPLPIAVRRGPDRQRIGLFVP